MKSGNDYIEINRKSWNHNTPVHIASRFYDQEGFINGRNTLNEIELILLGDVSGKSILHLQCHFGQDSLSLERMGAMVTGADFSDIAIDEARKAAHALDLPAKFICSDIYQLPSVLDEKFDLVFTSYGTIGWLPDLNKWASVISHFLKPGGKFVFAEFHPVVWMFDNEFKTIAYSYFNTGPIHDTHSGTYADRQASVEQQYISWDHGIGEVLSSLIGQKLEIASFTEFDYSPYNCFRNTIEIEPGKFQIEGLGRMIPMVYALTAMKKV